MGEVEAIKAISDALEKLQADEQTRVLDWAVSKFGDPSTARTAAPAAPAATPGPNANAKRPKAAKKGKIVISMDKSLNLAPKGKQSALEFAKLKAPSSATQKSVVAVYYLRDLIQMPKVTAQAVFTFFKSVQWPVPADLKNTLQQAGSAGWLDTADSEDIKLTALGENLIEHSLPAKAKV